MRVRDGPLTGDLVRIRGRIARDPTLTDVIPMRRMAHAPHLAPAGRVEATAASPVLHAAQIPEVAAARHAVANSILDSAEAVHDQSSAVADVALVDPKSRGANVVRSLWAHVLHSSKS